MTSESWRRRRGLRGLGTILLIACGLLMAVPLVSATGPPAHSVASEAIARTPPVASGTVCGVGNDPLFPAYDPVNHDVYVPNHMSGNLTILSGACKVVATVSFPSGALPFVSGFDPSNSEVYVTDANLNQVYVISGTRIIDTITSPSFDEPRGIAFDPRDAVMAVANFGSNTVTFIDASTNKIAGMTTVGSAPYMFAYDPRYARLLVSNYDSDNVTSLNAASPTVEKDNINIPAGDGPVGIAFDPADQYDYVANVFSNNVTVISAIGHQYGSVPAGSQPYDVVWDQADLSVDAASYISDTVSVIKGLKVVDTITGPSSAGFVGIEYDDATDQVFVTRDTSADVYLYGSPVTSAGPVTNGTSCDVGTEPYFDTYDPVTHTVYVPNTGSSSVTILSGACKVVGTVTLPAGAVPLAAGFNPTDNRVYVPDRSLNQVYVISGSKIVKTINSATFDGPSQASFDPGDGLMAIANSYSDNVTFVSGETVTGTTVVGVAPVQFAYDPIDGRFLVVNEGSQNVTSLSAANPTNEKDNINIPVGDSPDGIAFDPANGYVYVSSKLSNNVTVISGTGSQYGSVSVGSEPAGVVWDQAKLEIYVASYQSTSVAVIDGLKVIHTYTGPSGADFEGITYDFATDQVFVTAASFSQVYVYT